MKKILKFICLILAISALSCAVVSCDEKPIDDKAFYDYTASNTGKGTDIRMLYVEREIDSMKAEDFVESDKQSDFIMINVKDYGSIVAALRSDIAPISVANIKKLVSEKFYDGTVFHRVIENFMIQGGGCTVEVGDDGKTSSFIAKEAETVKGEFASNGIENHLSHVRGVLSMARATDKNSASSQFFIIHQTNSSSLNLNGEYASFGYVLAGMEVVDAIATCEVYAADTSSPFPAKDVVIESVRFVEPKDKLW